MAKRTKTLGLHEWTEKDTIITFYITKYGTKGLYLKTEADIASYLGVTVGSLKMQMANFRALLGSQTGVLSDYSNIQEKVFNEYNDMTQYHFMKIVHELIGQDEIERNEILRKMGKDPSKMKFIKK